MTTRAVTLTSLAILCAFFGVLLSGDAAARKRGPGAEGEPTASQTAVHELRQEIAAIELYNALNLSADQRAAIAELIADALAEREAREAARAAAAPELEGLLQDYLEELKKGAPSVETVASLQAFRAANAPEPGTHRAARKGMAEQLDALLTGAQLDALKTFRPMADVGPSPEERAERHSQRAEQVRERAGERSRSPERAEQMMEQRSERRERREAHRRMQRVLMSPAFLDLLG